MNMTNEGAGLAVAQAIANAVKASGAIVRIEPEDFQNIISRSENPLVIVASGGVFSRSYQYLTSYRGFILYTKTGTPVQLPGRAEVLQATKIWVPG
jgi:hypothetical protein